MSISIKKNELSSSELRVIKSAATAIPSVKTIRLPNGRTHTPKVDPVKVYEDDGELLTVPKHFATTFPSLSKINISQREKIELPRIQIEPRDYQVEMIDKCIGKLEEYGSLLTKFCPGYGKTIISMFMWKHISKKCIVLVNKTALVPSWKKTIETVCPGKLHIFGAPKRDNKHKIEDADIIICMSGKVKNIPEEIRAGISLMIVDEAHLFCTPSHIKPLLSFSPEYIIFLTATPFRENEMQVILDYFVNKKSWVGVRSMRPYSVNLVKTGINTNALCRIESLDPNYYNRCQSARLDDDRNSLIEDIVLKARSQSKKVIVMTPTTEHVDILFEKFQSLENINPQCYYKGLKSVSEYNVLIATMPKISTGFDEAMACENFDGFKSSVLILCTSIKSEGLFEQTVGRVQRSENPHVVILDDNDHAVSNHIKGIESYVESTNGKIYKFAGDLEKLDFDTCHDWDGPQYIVDEKPLDRKCVIDVKKDSRYFNIPITSRNGKCVSSKCIKDLLGC